MSSLAAITAGITSIVTQVASGHPKPMKVRPWSGELNHVPPAAWFRPVRASVAATDGWRITDSIPWELWFVLPHRNERAAELTELAVLADRAFGVIDNACSPANRAATFGSGVVATRSAWEFTHTGGGDEGKPAPALLIVVSTKWSTTHC